MANKENKIDFHFFPPRSNFTLNSHSEKNQPPQKFVRKLSLARASIDDHLLRLNFVKIRFSHTTFDSHTTRYACYIFQMRRIFRWMWSENEWGEEGGGRRHESNWTWMNGWRGRLVARFFSLSAHNFTQFHIGAFIVRSVIVTPHTITLSLYLSHFNRFYV